MTEEQERVFIVPNANKNLYVATLVQEGETSRLAYDPIIAFACSVNEESNSGELYYGSTPVTVGTFTSEDDPHVICNIETKYWWVSEEVSGSSANSMRECLLEINNQKQ